MRYALRAATDADYDFLYRLNETTMRGYVVRVFGAWDDAFQARRFRERFDPSRISVVTVGGRDVGMLETEATNHEVVLANIRIAPEYQNRGLGTAILGHVLDDAHRSDRAVRLRVLIVNPARVLYERLGFHVVEEAPPFSVMRAPPPAQ